MHWHISFLSPDRLVWTVAGLVATELIVLMISIWTRPSEEITVRWRVPAARMVAVAALFLCIPKPVITTPAASADGDICVLIDRSWSMSAKDPARSPARCIALADVAGMLAPASRTREGTAMKIAARHLLELSDAVTTAHSEVDFAQLSGKGIDAARRRLGDALQALSESAAALRTQTIGQANAGRLFAICGNLVEAIARIKSNAAPARGWFRLQQLVENGVTAADEPQELADAALYRDDAAARSAADEILATSRFELVRNVVLSWQRLVPNGPTVSVFEATPALKKLALDHETSLTTDGETSDLNGAIAAAQSLARKNGSLAIVLFSDGRQVGGSRGASGFDVPVITVNVGVRGPASSTTRPASGPTTELADVNPDEENLRRIARASDGDYLRIDECDSLGERLRDLAERTPRTIEHPLWDSPAIYFIVVGCLAVEWSSRKARGLL